MQLAIFGATGLVGKELFSLLKHLRPLRFARTQSVDRDGPIESIKNLNDYEIDLAFLATPKEDSKDITERLLEKGVKIIDGSSASRAAFPRPGTAEEAGSHRGPPQEREREGPVFLARGASSSAFFASIPLLSCVFGPALFFFISEKGKQFGFAALQGISRFGPVHHAETTIVEPIFVCHSVNILFK